MCYDLQGDEKIFITEHLTSYFNNEETNPTTNRKIPSVCQRSIELFHHQPKRMISEHPLKPVLVLLGVDAKHILNICISLFTANSIEIVFHRLFNILWVSCRDEQKVVHLVSIRTILFTDVVNRIWNID